MPSKLPMLHLVVEEDLRERLDDFRFKHRFTSRSAAMKWLLNWALTQDPKPDS